MKNFHWIFYIIFFYVLCGCAGVEVHKAKGLGEESTRLNGIPFRVKIPAWYQETKISETGWAVEFTISDSKSKSSKTSKDTSVKIPGDGTLVISCASASEARAIVNSVVADAMGNNDIGTVAGIIRSKLGALDELKRSRKECTKIISNVVVQTSIISPTPYFITHKIPLFGSGEGNFEFSSDGTITKATSAATDDTAKTLLGLFPVKDKLIARWNLSDSTDKSNLASVTKASTIVVDAMLTPQVTIYTLRKNIGLDLAQVPKIDPPLVLSDAEHGRNDVQLFSTERNEEGPAPKANANSKAYKIEGSIAPPPAEK